MDLPSQTLYLAQGRIKSASKPLSEFRLGMSIECRASDEILPAQNLNRRHRHLTKKSERWRRPKTHELANGIRPPPFAPLTGSPILSCANSVTCKPRPLPYSGKIASLQQAPQLHNLVLCLACHMPRSIIGLGILQHHCSALVRRDSPSCLIRKPAVWMLDVRLCQLGQSRTEIIICRVRATTTPTTF